MVITGAVVEHREDVNVVVLYTRAGWVTWWVFHDGTRVEVERVDLTPDAEQRPPAGAGGR